MIAAASYEDIEGGGTVITPSEETPLLVRPQELEDDPKSIDNSDSSLGTLPKWTGKEMTVAGAAGVTVVSSIGTMLASTNPLVTISGATGLIVPPYSAVQQRKITECEAMQQTNEVMERELNNLHLENDRLIENVSAMESSVTDLQDMEETLESIQQLESQSVEELELQLKESQEILDSMQTSLRETVVQNIISVVLCCDKDGNYHLDDEEIEELMSKIEGTQGVEINREKARAKIVECGRDLDAVMELIQKFLNDADGDTPKKDQIFTFSSNN